MAGLDDPASFDDSGSVIPRPMEHLAKIDLREPPVKHPLEQVRAELEFPIPPRRPLVLRQICLLRIDVPFSAGSAERLPRTLHPTRDVGARFRGLDIGLSVARPTLFDLTQAMRSARRHATIACSEPGVLMLPASAGVLVPLHAGREDVRPGAIRRERDR